jgi:hypothetical protein
MLKREEIYNMTEELWIDKTLSKLLPQCGLSAWELYMTRINGGQSQYNYQFSKALKDHTYENLNDDTKQYIANCQESNRIAKEKGIDLRYPADQYTIDRQISSICEEVTKNLPDARTDSEKKIVFAWGSEKEDED